MILEVCCASLDDAIKAEKAGAERIELVSSLFLGGLTPSFATFRLIKENTNLKIINMIRPRGAGFVYSENDKKIMFEDAHIFLEAEVDGLAFGFLNDDLTIDLEATKKMIDLCHKYNKEAVFHRAIDCVDNYEKSIKCLYELGIDRILTSGGEKNAYEGRFILNDIQFKYPDLEILAGCGVNETNIREIINDTCIKQFHSSCKEYKKDFSTCGNNVSYGYNQEHLDSYEIVDFDKVRKIRKLIDKKI